MDHLFELFAAVALWRVLLCSAIGVAVAFLLNLLIPAFGPAGGFFVAFVGAAVGVVWQIRVVSAKEAAAGRTVQPLSKPVSFLGIALIGGVWGGLAGATIGPLPAAIALVVVPLLLAPLFASIAKQPITRGQQVFAITALLIGFATPYAINMLFTVEAF